MNNSDPTLTTHEEKLTAYLDGRLSAEEAAAFEQAYPEAARERAASAKLHAALQRGTPAPAMRHTEFFNRQILREIASSSAAPAAVREKGHPFNLWRLILAGAFCLLLAAGLYKTITPTRPAAREYFAEVISFKAGDDSLTARVVSEGGLAIVMIDGLEPMEEEFILN